MNKTEKNFSRLTMQRVSHLTKSFQKRLKRQIKEEKEVSEENQITSTQLLKQGYQATEMVRKAFRETAKTRLDKGMSIGLKEGEWQGWPFFMLHLESVKNKKIHKSSFKDSPLLKASFQVLNDLPTLIFRDENEKILLKTVTTSQEMFTLPFKLNQLLRSFLDKVGLFVLRSNKMSSFSLAPKDVTEIVESQDEIDLALKDADLFSDIEADKEEDKVLTGENDPDPIDL